MSPEIRVRANVPFTVTPNFEQEPQDDDYDDGMRLDRIRLIVEDLGIRGFITFIEVPSELTSTRPVIFPAGPALPVSIRVDLADLTMSGVERVRCAIICEGKTYLGDREYDRVELIEREAADLRFRHWIDPETRKPSQALFSREAVGNIQYIVGI